MKKICLPCQKEFDSAMNFCLECGNTLETIEDPTEKIVNCHFEYKCPLEWKNLEKTDDEDIRFCHSCEKNVFFAHSQYQIDTFARQGQCVAFQPGWNLKFDDIPPPPLMGVLVSPERMIEFEIKKEESEQTAKNIFAAPDKTKTWWKFWK